MPVSGFGLPSQRVDWVNTVNRAPWAHTSASQGRPRGATSATGRRRAGVDSDEPNAAARLGRGAGFAHRGSAGLWLGAFDRAFDAASTYGGGAARNRLERRRREARRSPEFGRFLVWRYGEPKRPRFAATASWRCGASDGASSRGGDGRSGTGDKPWWQWCSGPQRARG